MAKKKKSGVDVNADIVADVVIIGGGLLGGLMAWDLQRRGINVAIIDSGPPVDRVAAVQRFKADPHKNGNSAYEKKDYAPVPDAEVPGSYYVQNLDQASDPFKQVKFGGLYLRQIGGTSWHYTGHIERMYPNDFRMKKAYGHGKNWPISYKTLEPFYAEVERQWGVAGNDTCVAPTPHPYPLPYVPNSYLDEQVNKAAAQLGESIGPLPHCRASVPFPFQGRPQCCGNTSCNLICPTGAKYDGSVHVGLALKEGALIYPNSVVYKIDVDSDKKVRHIHYRNFADPKNPVDGVASGKLVILAAHAIEAPRLLLMSAGENAPDGVANSSDQVGRNLMGFVGVDVKAYVPEPVYPYRGPVNATGVFRGLRDGSFRKKFASIGSYVNNGGFDTANGTLDVATEAIDEKNLFGSDLRHRVRSQVSRQVLLENAVETLPNPNNRVTLAKEKTAVMGLPRPQIDFRIDKYTYEGIYQSWKRTVEVLTLMGGENLPTPDRASLKKIIDETPLQVGAPMIAGTTCMGKSSRSSVVNQWGRSHDHNNLFIIGTGTYVTGGSVSPSLTAAAFGLRATQHIVDTFNWTEE